MSYNNTKLVAGLLGYALLACSISGCSFDSFSKTATETSSESSSSATEITYLNADDMFTDRDKEVGYDEDTATTITLSDNASSCDSSSVSISDNTITITDEGTYLLTGSLSDGQIIVNADDKKVQLVLDSVDINCDTSAALYVKAADKVFVTLASDSENTLSNTNDFVAIDDNNIDAVIFSKDDLTLNGSGTLTVTAKYGHGIVSKDDLVITSGTYQITAAKHALSGQDSVRIADGILTLNAGTDGIHSENTDDDTKGFIYIANGDISITADSDGFDAEETLQVDGGNIEVYAGDDGLHSDDDLIITAGTINVTKSYEGLEGMTVTIEDGDISVVSSDDGINASGDGSSGDSSSDTKNSSADNNSGDTNANERHPRTETPHRVTLLRKNWMALILPKTGRNHLTDSIKMITLQRIVTQIVIPTVNPQICRTEMPDRATEMEVPAVATVVWAVATVVPAVEWKRQPITISFRSVAEKFTSTQAVTALTPTEI